MTRRVGEAGRAAPASIEAVVPVAARFGGKPVVASFANGLVEATCRAEVLIPGDAADAPGQRRADFLLRWPDGQSSRHTLTWKVNPRIAASPDGFVILADAQSDDRKVTPVAIDGKPFRVVGLDGAGLAGGATPLPTPAATRHQLDLAIGGVGEPGTREIRINTNHPFHPLVSLSLLTLPGQKRGTE